MNFIGIYDDILTADDCNVIIQYFNKHPDREAGKIGYGFVDPELKDSTDVYTRFSESSLTHRIIYSALVKAFEKYEKEHKNLQYTDAKNLPSGTEVEIFDYKLLKLIYELSVDSSETEYLTYYVKDHLSQFRTGSLETKKNLKKIRLTLDTKKDLKRIIKFLSEMKNKNKLHTYNLNDIEKFYFRNKSLFKIQKKNKSLKIINTNFNWSKIIN